MQLPQTLNAIGLATRASTLSTEQLSSVFSTLTTAQMASHVAWETLTDDQVQSALIAAGLSAEQTDVIMNMYLSANATSADAAANTADAAAKGANTTATFSLTAALKGLWATIAAHPGVVVLAILTAITAAIVYASGAQERAIQKQREYTEELKQEYSTLQGEVQSLTDELDTAKSRIDELQGKDSLSFVEQEELSRLEKQNELLTKQIELRKLDAAEKAKETNESIAKEFELEYNTTSPKYQSIKTENQVVPAIKEWRSNKLTASQQEQLTFWVETGVLWAKQWLQSETGEQKKAQVTDWVRFKVKELGLPFSDEDIDKCIEAIYSTVKDVVDVTTGRG